MQKQNGVEMSGLDVSAGGDERGGEGNRFEARDFLPPTDLGASFPTPAVVGQAKLLAPEKMKHSIKLVDDQMNWCDSAIEVRLTV